MPTTIPVRHAVIVSPLDGLAEFAGKLVQIYAVIAFLAAAAAMTENHFGMFTGLSIAESILKLTNTDLPSVESGQLWSF